MSLKAVPAVTTTVAPTLDELRLWPPTCDPPAASAALGISRSYGYELIKRGEFPVRTLQVGGKTRVLTADLMRVLGISPTSNDNAPDMSEAGPARPAAATVAPKDITDGQGTPRLSALHVLPPVS